MKHYLIKEYGDGKKMSVVIFEKHVEESFDGTHHMVNIDYLDDACTDHKKNIYLDKAREIYKEYLRDGYKKTNETEDIISYISEQEKKESEFEEQEMAHRLSVLYREEEEAVNDANDLGIDNGNPDPYEVYGDGDVDNYWNKEGLMEEEMSPF